MSRSEGLPYVLDVLETVKHKLILELDPKRPQKEVEDNLAQVSKAIEETKVAMMLGDKRNF